jgi:flavodoxin
MSKILVLFYSYEGSTRKIAELIAAETGADIEEIKPVKEMKSKGFAKYVWGGGQVVMKRRPELKPLNVNLDNYDTIFLGSPVWAFTYSPPIASLLEKGYLKGKQIAFFHCCEGAPAKTEEDAKAAIENENTWLAAFGCTNVPENYENLKDQVATWAKEIVNK